MCGRVILTLSAKMIREILNNELDVNDLNIDDFVPRYNLGPGQSLLTVIRHQNKNRAGYLNWNYLPDWTDEIKDGYKFINARSETIHEKVSFKDSFFQKRCLILINGFYEWDTEKTPYLFQKNFDWFTLAGIWNSRMIKGEKRYGLSVVTTKANDLMKPIHHRMPVIIPKKSVNAWLDPETDLQTLEALMQPVDNNFLSCYQVSKHVNKIKNDDPLCIEKVG